MPQPWHDRYTDKVLPPALPRRSWWGWTWRIVVSIISLVLLVIGVLIAYQFLVPPFGSQTVARVLLVGLDQPEHKDDARRSDTIILCAVRLDGSGTTLMSIPRDSYVNLSRYRKVQKINSAYTFGGVALLQNVLADSRTLQADLPYYLVFDSATVAAVIDALGGVEVDVPTRMDYDDDWGNLHIHLKPGLQRLNGQQVVGFLRWRKNNNGRGGSDDFKRAERQRQVVAALARQARAPEGIKRLPRVYAAFRNTTHGNLSTRQLITLVMAARDMRESALPARTGMSRGISYVFVDWDAGRDLWATAIK